MSLSVGIVGLPNVGKSTLFNALLRRELAVVGPTPFTTIEPNTGVVSVPDERFEKLVDLVKKTTKNKDIKTRPATIKFVDIAGLVKGAAEGAGLGNKFLSHIRETDLVLHVLRQFEDPRVAHVSGRIDPIGDAKTVDLELILADFEVVSKAIEERRKKSKKDKKFALESEILEKVKQTLNEGQPALSAGLTNEEEKIIGSFNLLTLKPFIFIFNISEKELDKDFKKIKKNLPKGLIIPICAKLEAELLELSEDEQREYLKDLGITESLLPEIIKAAYKSLGLISFYTIAGFKQASSWSVKEGSTALEAAGQIHTDFARKFIKAEVIPIQKLLKVSSWQTAKQKGLLRLEGKDYKVQDGDVIEIKHS